MLSPYRVLDLSDERGQLCGRILADLGADVIVVEPPGGSRTRRRGPFAGDKPDPNGSFAWWALNRGKRSIALDIENEAERGRIRRLARDADFLIESFAPGYLGALELDHERLAAENPRLITVSITPFGQSGPKANWAATDLTVLAASGVLLLTGDEDRPPVKLPGGQGWLHAGAEAAVGALLALQARGRDGLGQHVDVSAQTAAMMATQSFILQAGWDQDLVMGRISGGAKIGPLRIRFVYPCKDGYVSLTFLFGTTIGPFTQRLFNWMAEEGFVDAATRDKDWVNYVALLLSGEEPVSELDRCTEAIARFLLSRTKGELFEEALRRGLLIVPVSTTADVVNSPQLAARGYWREVEHPDLGRTVRYPGPFACFSSTPIAYSRRPPLVGEHNGEVLGAASHRATSAPAQHAQSQPAPREPAAALAGLKVLDMSWVIATPFGVRYLADYGATVVHVEIPGRPDALRTYQPFKDGVPGADTSAQIANAQTGRLGISLNLGTPEGRELALRLVNWADVLVESYSPRAMPKWGMSYDRLREVNPALIMLSSCLNGQTGPHAGLAGFGTMGAQIAGFGQLTGWPDRPPAGPFVAYTDYVSPKFVAIALLAAIEHRRRTGEGQYIDLSQVEASLHFLGSQMLDYTVNGRVQTRQGNDEPDCCPHGVYPCLGDERWLAVAVQSEEQWRALCQVSGHSEWLLDPRFAEPAARREHAEALDAELGAWTLTKTVEETESVLQACGVPAHRASNSSDCFADPQLMRRGHFTNVEHPLLGSVPIESSRLRLSRTPARVSTPAPMIGQHNEQVLKEILGLDDEAISGLVLAGAIE
jgi:crotonobetainyl-CoA:carnitine CoA-transferase CaiB-like acyl-CoA transferase